MENLLDILGVLRLFTSHFNANLIVEIDSANAMEISILY